MIQDFIDALVGHRQAVVTATRGGAFLAEVQHFVARLQALPGHSASQLSAEQFELINSLSDEMIEHIESRIDLGKDDAEMIRKLAKSVYAIRENLEEIHTWRRHYLGS